MPSGSLQSRDNLAVELFAVDSANYLAIDRRKRRLVARPATLYAVFALDIFFRELFFHTLENLYRTFIVFTKANFHGDLSIFSDSIEEKFKRLQGIVNDYNLVNVLLRLCEFIPLAPFIY